MERAYMNITFHPDKLETKGFYIYKLTYQNGRPFYIGKGHKGRWKYHFKENSQLIELIKQKLKTQSLRVAIIKDNLTEEKAFELEMKLIKKYGRRDLGIGKLYNKSDGGEGEAGRIHSKEHKRKLSIASKINWKERDRNIPESVKNKISKTLKGKRKSKETKRKMSEANIGKTLSLEHRNKISESNKGRISPRKGVKLSNKTKLKMSKSTKINWQKRKEG